MAVSAETQLTFTDTDGDGLPDGWETEWGLNPNLADASFTWLVGAGLSARQLFAQGAKRVDYPATALQWDGKKRLHAYHYLAGGGGNGVVWQDWEGDAVYSANVIVEQEVSDGVWQQVGTAAVSDWAIEMPPSVTSNSNFRLRGEVSSCETECKVRLMMRTALVDRHKPGFVEFSVPTNPMPSAIKRYYSTCVIHESWSTNSVNTQGRSWDWKDTTVNLSINPSDGSLAWDEATSTGGGTSGTHSDGSSNGDSSDYTHSDSGWGADETPRDGDAVSSFARDGTDHYSHSWLTGSSHGSGHTGAGGSSTQPFHLQFDAGPPVWESRYYDFNSEVADYYSNWSGSFTGPTGTTTWSGNNTDYPGGDGPSQWPNGIESDSSPTAAVIHSGSGANTYEYTANLSGEYPTESFLANTLASLPEWVEPPGGKRDTTGNTWTVSMHDLGFAGVETPALLPAVGGYRMTSERFLSEDESSLYALRSQYALTCNDCEPQPTVILAEYKERYAPGTRQVSSEPGAQQIVETQAITPGATPGKSQTTPVKTSDLTAATENGRQGLGRLKAEISMRATGNLEPAPENGAYEATKAGFGGTDQLGPLPMGSGRAEAPGVCYTAPIQVIGSVNSLPGVEWRWKRWLSRRSWSIYKKVDGSGWIVRHRGSKGLKAPEDDTGQAKYRDETPSPVGSIYFADNSALDLLFTTSNIGDFLYEEKQFTYKIEFKWTGGTPEWKVANELEVGQKIIVKRKATTNNVLTDWEGIENSNEVRKLDLGITEAKVRAIVGGTLPIVIEDSAK